MPKKVSAGTDIEDARCRQPTWISSWMARS
jgi:hypothetical protein